jgi:PEP-CTERM motif
MRSRLLRHIIVAATLLATVATPAAAQQFEWLTGTSAADDPTLNGTLLAQRTSAFSYDVAYERHFPEPASQAGSVTGSLSSMVVRATDSSLDFYWRVIVDAESTVGVVQVNVSRFAAARLRAEWRRDLAGTVSPRFWVSAAEDHSFWFRDEYENAIYPGQRSAYFFIDTDAREYRLASAVVVSSDDSALRYSVTGQSQALLSFVPAGAIPEPQTWGLMLFGLAGLGAASVARKRRRG